MESAPSDGYGMRGMTTKSRNGDSPMESQVTGDQSQLLPALLKEQAAAGWISEEAAAEIGRELRVPLSEVYGIVEFYSMLTTVPSGETVVHICDSPVCRQLGSQAAIDAVSAELGIAPGEVDESGEFGLRRAPCLGQCDGGPAALVGSRSIWNLERSPVSDWLTGSLESPLGTIEGRPTRKSARCGQIDPISLDEFLAAGGYRGLERAVQEMTPEEVIGEIKRSKLVGRGGAAFPTGAKWEYAAAGDGPRYVVCNGDESEPGTFKDRILMEGDPFAVLEGMAIAGFAIGAAKGYLYVRGEYPRAQRILAETMTIAREAGYLGDGILGSDFNFEIEMRSGAGAYICGEETALFESIEGKRGFPRIKPPFPTVDGLFGRPTVINNVETLCDAAWILAHDADAHLDMGTEESAGTRLFCLSGDIGRPGIYERPYGASLGELLEAAGGPQGDLQCVLLGGAAGHFVGPAELDLALSHEATRDAGLSLGSGAVMAFNQSQSLPSILVSLAEFFEEESCGKCFPCQLGTRRQLELLERAAEGWISAEDQLLLQDVIFTMTEASLCGLGATAGVAVGSALERWPEVLANGARPAKGQRR